MRFFKFGNKIAFRTYINNKGVFAYEKKIF